MAHQWEQNDEANDTVSYRVANEKAVQIEAKTPKKKKF
jgi:hypothetical protein